MFEHRQNVNMLQTPEMTKHLSVLANTDDYCFFVIALALIFFLGNIY